jgi:calcium/calmodulin-dependent protein kinase I
VDFYEERGNPAASLAVTELCSEGNLQRYIDNNSGSLKRSDILRVTSQVAEALAYLHRRGQFHSDLKPDNVLIRKLNPIDVALADCADVKGISTKAKVRNTRLCRSPETAALDKYGGAGDDVWALGVTMLSMAAQLPRFEATNDGIREFPLRCLEHVDALVRLNPANDIVSLLSRMIVKSKSRRASASGCSRLAKEYLAVEGKGWEHDAAGRIHSSLGIRSPKEFQPRSFW